MVYQNKGPAEHPSRTIIKTMQAAAQSGVFPRLILLCGKEDFLINWSLDYLKQGLLNPATASIDCNEFSEDAIDADAIIQSCLTMPFMSTKKLVIVKDSDIFSAQAPKDIHQDDLGRLCSFLADIPDTTMLVFTCSKANKTKTIYKTIAKNGLIYDFIPLDDGTLGGWMAKRFATAGKNASRSDMINFAKLCGYGDADRNYTLYNLENDLKIIFALYDKQSISLDDMMSACSGQDEINSFKLLDCAFGGKKGEALKILHSTIDIQAPSKEMGVILSFLGLLISQLEIMVEGREREDEKQNSYDIVKEMGVNEYRFKKAMQSCKGKTANQLRKTLDNAFQIEKDLKTGNIDARTGLELFITNI